MDLKLVLDTYVPADILKAGNPLLIAEGVRIMLYEGYNEVYWLIPEEVCKGCTFSKDSPGHTHVFKVQTTQLENFYVNTPEDKTLLLALLNKLLGELE